MTATSVTILIGLDRHTETPMGRVDWWEEIEVPIGQVIAAIAADPEALAIVRDAVAAS